jgi:hypothetical protein
MLSVYVRPHSSHFRFGTSEPTLRNLVLHWYHQLPLRTQIFSFLVAINSRAEALTCVGERNWDTIWNPKMTHFNRTSKKTQDLFPSLSPLF